MSIRVSTTNLFEQGLSAIADRQRGLLDVQQQVSTGRRVARPSDDPIAAGRILDVTQSQAVSEQFVRNADSAESALSLTERNLSGVVALLQDVRATMVAAGNPALGNAGRATLAGDLGGRYQDLLGLANATDGQGNYLYSGYRGAIRPFSETAPGQVLYAGDQGQRLIQLSPSRFIEVSESGADVFQRVRTGNGAFLAQAGAGNTGTARIGAGSVVDPAAWEAPGNPGRFTVRFDVDSSAVPAVTTYDIVDAVSGNSLLTGAAASPTGPYARTYVSGSAIALRSQGAEPAFDMGINVAVEGDPADGDTVSIERSGTQDVFATIHQAIQALSTPVNGAQGEARLANAITLALSNLDNALGRALDVQTSLGSRQREVESTRSTSADLADQYTEEVSRLRDVDLARAISDLTLQQTLLQAAQQSFLRVQNLSLFELL